MSELKTTKQKVEKILKEFEKARNSDGTLIAHFLNTFSKKYVHNDKDGEPCIKLRDFKNLPSFENIRRSRQIIQNDDGNYPPTDPEIIKKRNIKEKNWRDCEVREAKHTTEDWYNK